MTHARRRRQEAREALNAGYQAHRDFIAAQTARVNEEYKELASELEAKAREASAEAKAAKEAYEARMKELTGSKKGVGTWKCSKGHTHRATSECGKANRSDDDNDFGLSLGSTAKGLPLNRVAGQVVSRAAQAKWQ